MPELRFAAAVKREYGGKPTKRERALAIKRLIDKFDVALSDIEAALTPAISSGLASVPNQPYHYGPVRSDDPIALRA